MVKNASCDVNAADWIRWGHQNSASGYVGTLKLLRIRWMKICMRSYVDLFSRRHFCG